MGGIWDGRGEENPEENDGERPDPHNLSHTPAKEDTGAPPLVHQAEVQLEFLARLERFEEIRLHAEHTASVTGQAGNHGLEDGDDIGGRRRGRPRPDKAPGGFVSDLRRGSRPLPDPMCFRALGVMILRTRKPSWGGPALIETTHLQHTDLFIDGKWQAARKGGTFAVENPATEAVIAQVADGGPEEATLAVDAAYRAFIAWRGKSAYERCALVHRWYEAILDERESIARLITLENGKPVTEARAEVDYAAGFVGWFAEEGKRIYGRTIPARTPDKRLLALRQPVGVVASITPWNFPAAMVTRKVAPALAAGCTVVMRPASQTPLTALRLVELWEAVGGPGGTLNLVTGTASRAIADAWLGDARVRKITFTGSTAVGQELMRKAIPNLQRVSMELGGQAPLLVFDDADPDVVLEGLMASKFRNGGQSCIASNRFLVQEGIVAALEGRIVEATRSLRVGDGFDEGVAVGPMIDEKGREKVLAHVADARDHGATVATGGKAMEGQGYFVEPTVLTGVTSAMKVMEEETFGPVIAIATFRTEEEGIRLANASPFGLAAYTFTQDAGRAWRVAEALEYGIVGLNDGLPSTAQAPFGGWKLSGVGREGGMEGMDAFLETKYVSWGHIGG